MTTINISEREVRKRSLRKVRYSTVLKAISLIVLLLTIVYSAFAQGPGFDNDVDDVPVDGGVSLLVAAGVGYGVKKYRETKKKKDDLMK